MATLRNLGVSYLGSHDFAAVAAAQPRYTMTLVREPRSRLLSEYLYSFHTSRPGHAPPAGSLLDFVRASRPIYVTLPRCDLCGVTEWLHPSVRENELLRWPRPDLGGSMADVRRALDDRCAPDLDRYRTVIGHRGPDPEAVLAYTLAKFRLGEE